MLATRIVAAFAVLALAGAGCAPGSWPGAYEHKEAFGASVAVDMGSSKLFEDGMRLTLKEIDDSRCKPGVVCIWQGELSGVFDVSGGSLASPVEVRLGTERSKTAQAGIYRIDLDAATDTAFTVHVTVPHESAGASS